MTCTRYLEVRIKYDPETRCIFSRNISRSVDSGRLSFRYNKTYLTFEKKIPISLSMPLSVEAFPDKISRLHQENFCQVLSVPPELKYEREGGPSIAKCFKILDDFSSQPGSDRLGFIRILIFNYLIGNAEAHGKNFSFLYKGKEPKLAPAYDLFSTAVYPELSKKMAMKIGGHYDPDTLLERHWLRIAPEGIGAQKTLKKTLVQMAKACVDHALILKAEYAAQNITAPIIDDICHIIQIRAKKFS